VLCITSSVQTLIIIPTYCQSNTLILIVLTYYTGNMFRLIIESSSGPYIQIQILGYCNCVMGSHTLTYYGSVYIMINWTFLEYLKVKSLYKVRQ
jgi:hypothetical protein